MARRIWKRFQAKEAAVELSNQLMQDKSLLPCLILLFLFSWAVERWLVPFSNWVPLAAAVWVTIQYGEFQRRQLVEDMKDMNKRWKQLVLHTSPTTPLEPCKWLNKLLVEVWPKYMGPRLSNRFSSMVERKLKDQKPKLIEKIELKQFSLGSCPPNFGQNGMQWITSGDKQVMRLGFDWDSVGMSILLHAKWALGTIRIIINSIHIKGDLLLRPILDGQAVLYSFESTPDMRVNVAFGRGRGQALPETELPGVSSWLEKLLAESITKLLVEPRCHCYSLPIVDLHKKAVGGLLSVTVISVSNLDKINLTGNNSETYQGISESIQLPGNFGNKALQTFIKVEIGNLTRTIVCDGLNPRWDTTFNMMLHGETGILKFYLYKSNGSSVNLNYLTSCEIKMKYVADDSTMFWAIGQGSGVVAKQAENCGTEVEMTIPFEGSSQAELTVRLVLREWQFSDGSTILSKSVNSAPQLSAYGPHNLQTRTERTLKVTVLEGRNLANKDKPGKCDPYVKLQYGKVSYRTKTIPNNASPVWNQKFDFDEIGSGGEYLEIRCYSTNIFGDENIGSARVNLEGISEGSNRDDWIPLEKVNSGEVKLLIEVVKNDDNEISKNPGMKQGSGWIELVLIEAKDLVAADVRGTSDPFVRVHYGTSRKQTKVIYKTLNPEWNQTLEFPDTSSPLTLHVKDHNTVLPTSSIGRCTVEYEGLLPNQTADKWIPLQGVKNGEIHVKITRKTPEVQKKSSSDTPISPFDKAHNISTQMRDMLKQLQCLIDKGDREALSLALSELENAEDDQEKYMIQLESEKALMISKIDELDHEVTRASSGPTNCNP